MNREQHKLREAQRYVCTRPGVSGQLYDYVADLLEDPAAEEFEYHLLDCPRCRREYLKLMSLRGAPRVSVEARAGNGVARDGKVISMDRFRRGRP